MPALFLGHGNPMNAVTRTSWSEAWSAIGALVPRPRAVLCISAHWYVPGSFVTAMREPRTIHDFEGFPEELYKVEYPAPGDPEIARRVQALLAPLPVRLDKSWGLDHGTWSVFRHVYPDASVPIVQLSIDRRQPAAFHFELGKKLAVLRDEGILVAGSGNLVHNLRHYAWGRPAPEPYDWAVRFESRARALIVAGDHESLIHYGNLGPDAQQSIPTPDHYLPLLYVLATRRDGDAVTFPSEGIEGGSLSMLAVSIG